MSNCRVMVVDENTPFREVVVSLIVERGFEAYAAADGIDALRQIYDVMPQVIVADAVLPDLSGFRFLPFVRRRFPDIGVIAMKGEPVGVFQMPDVVADRVIQKNPFNPSRFLASIEELAKGTVRRAEDMDSHRRMIEISERQMNLCMGTPCPSCEILVRAVAEARLNSMLAITWDSTREEHESAEEVVNAERRLGQALAELNQHRRDRHGLEKVG